MSIVLKYDHICITTSNLLESIKFYKIIGFNVLSSNNNITILSNNTDFKLHLIETSNSLEDNNNLLMDFPTQKYPGITHFCIEVSSTLAMEDYLISNNIALSGKRPNPKSKLNAPYSLFVRDNNRNVIEFQRQSLDDSLQEPDIKPVLTLSDISNFHIAHTGIRIADGENAKKVYVDILGFDDIALYYPQNKEDILKNEIPWIFFTKGDQPVEMNLLLNANNSGKNVLLSDDSSSERKPGMTYACFKVKEVNVEALLAKGAVIYTNEEAVVKFGLTLAQSNDFQDIYKKSVYLQDSDLNLIRLVEL